MIASSKLNQLIRRFSTENRKITKGLVLGVHCNDSKEFILTDAAENYNRKVSGKLLNNLNIVKSTVKPGKVKVFYSLCSNFDAVALVGLPKTSTSIDELEGLDEAKEGVRIAASAGCRSLQENGITNVSVETFNDAEAAAEGSYLGIWKFQEFKSKKENDCPPQIINYENKSEKEWKIGSIKADAQNIARRLMDMPSNKMTPRIFATVAEKLLRPCEIDVKVRDQNWIAEKKMESFLSVAKGSVEPPVFLEIKFQKQNNENPIVLIGKGVTFDSGGISIKPSSKMEEMKADMGGAACVLATILSAAELELPLNIIGLIPLCENMPSGNANRPGDIVTAMNGKTIQIDNTDAEGRLILADALCYAANLKPKFTLDIATLTGAMRVALGGAATGVFSNSTYLWQHLNKAGQYTGDRVWRFPLWNYYTRQVTDYPSVDVNNVGKSVGGGSCKAAAFLKEFCPPGDWLHLDIASVMGPSDDCPYLHNGMTGRPTRTLTQFLIQLSQSK